MEWLEKWEINMVDDINEEYFFDIVILSFEDVFDYLELYFKFFIFFYKNMLIGIK